MFTIITNNKKMFSSFIKNKLSPGPAVSPAGSSTPVKAKDFKKGDDLQDLKNLQKMFIDNKIDSKEMKVINNSINDIT
jgi:hypothetical protein